MMQTTLEHDIRTSSPIAMRSEVAALVEVTPERLGSWSQRRGGRAPLVHTVRANTRFTVPLVGIAEAASLQALHEGGMSIQEARKAADFIRYRHGEEYALASPRLFTDGTDAFIEDADGLARLRDQQGVIREAIAAHLRPLIMGPDGFVEAFHVEQFTASKVTIDPRFNAGRMSFTHNRVPVFTVTGAIAAGEKLEDVASDFELTHAEVEEVVRLIDWLAKVT
jgi:uncharacterized protein (DUF433 family)